MLAAIMALTIGAVNAGCAVILQVVDLTVVFSMRYVSLQNTSPIEFAILGFYL